jgi:uncharacterized membrane protein YfcA
LFDAATQILATLALAAFLAGFVDSIAGGGGLISVPALLLAGLSPVDALGTNKLQGLFGSASATIAYAGKGHVDLRQQAPSAILAFLGGAAGAGLAAILPGELLRLVLPFVLIGIALFFAFKPNLGNVDSARRLSPLVFGAMIVPAIGFYDGIFGPGAGSFFMLAFVTLAGYGLLKATAHTKLLNFSSNTGGFVVFALAGVVHWKIGLIMGVAQFLGARLGAALAMRGGAKVIKPLLVLSCIALATKLLMDPAHPLRIMIGF